MEDTNPREGPEPSMHETESMVEEVSQDGQDVPFKPVIPETLDIPSKDLAEVKSSDAVKEPEIDAAKEAVKDINAGELTEASTANGTSANVATPSQRVQEGRSWNDRNREKLDYSKNIKSDLTSQEQSDDPDAIRKQVEFYFSDSNLLLDKFLFTKVEGHKNLPVPISIIHSFNRMRHFQPFSAVVEAIRESTVLNLVENNTCIQRKIPLAEGLRDRPMREIGKVYEDEAMARSIYAKGFGEEKPSTQFDIEAFFADYGPTNSVRLRRAHDRMFKGSVFVEFDSENTQKSFLALDPKPKWKGQDLEIKSKKNYCDEKVEDIKAGRIQPNSVPWVPRGNHQNIRGDRRGSDHDGRDWRARREDDRKDGFGDRKHRGFGSSGQNGRGGGRGGRGHGRGGRDGRNNNRRKVRDEHQVPKIAVPSPDIPEALSSTITTQKTSAPEPSVKTNSTEHSTATPLEKQNTDAPPTETTTAFMETVSKKRARGDDDGETSEPKNAKKPDLKSSEVLES